jgi:hypothetical protein
MNSGKKLGGWWRLWIVLSVIWSITVTIAGYEVVTGISSVEQRKSYGISSACNDVVGGNYVKAVETYGEATILRAAADHAGDTPEVKDFVQRCASAINKDYAPDRQTDLIKTWTVLALCWLLPPLILLVIGLCLRWIVRGFRGNRAQGPHSRQPQED